MSSVEVLRDGATKVMVQSHIIHWVFERFKKNPRSSGVSCVIEPWLWSPCPVRINPGPLQELDQGPLQELDQGLCSTKVCAPTKVRSGPRCAHRPSSPSGARPRCAHRPRSPSGARPRCAHRPSSELDQVPSSTKVCAPTKVPFRSSTVRTDQGPSSIKVRAGPFAPSRVRFRSSTKFRVRPRCAPRPRSELDQGPSWTVRTVQGPSLIKVRAGPCAPSRVRAQPSSEFDQGVHPDQGPSSTKVG